MRKPVAVVTGIALSLVLCSPALAARPANQACLGETLRVAAKMDGFAELVNGVARDIRGVGEEVQAVLAGSFPDEAFPNTCND